MSKSTNTLIVLRGPSGSGKTTAAKKILELTERRTAIIHQDHYRFMFKPAGGGSRKNGPTIHKMIEHNIATALADGYDVILEGVLTRYAYGDILSRISGLHEGPQFYYLFQVELEETIRRNTSKLEEAAFTADDMREWYPSCTEPLGLREEHTIDGDLCADRVVDYILSTSQLLEAPK
jgi:predicted kinase